MRHPAIGFLCAYFVTVDADQIWAIQTTTTATTIVTMDFGVILNAREIRQIHQQANSRPSRVVAVTDGENAFRNRWLPVFQANSLTK